MPGRLATARLGLLLALGLPAWAALDCAHAIAPAEASLSAPTTARIVHTVPSEFNRRVLVVDEGGLRVMRFGDADGRDQSRIKPGKPEQLPMPYLRSAAVGLGVPMSLERMLVIGLGGGAFPSFIRTLFPDVQIDAVEIDPVVARIATEYFDLKAEDRLQVHVLDAVDFVKQPRKGYDYILVDAYDADDLPDALVTHDFLSDVHASLSTGGVAVVNIAITNEYEARRLIDKLTGFFKYCLNLRSEPSLNDVLLLSDAALPDRAVLREQAEQLQTDESTTRGMVGHIDAARACTAPYPLRE